MDKIKQNKFWVGLGAAGVVLVALFVVLVMDAWGEAELLQTQNRTTLRQLEALEAEVPGKPDLDAWKATREKVLEDYATLTAHYAESDKHLERWFDVFAGGAAPNRGQWMGHYRDEIRTIERELAAKGTRIGIKDDWSDPEEKARFGLNWEDPTPAQWGKIGASEPAVLKELQKRFWARQLLADAILADGGPKVHRIHDFRFFKKLHPSLSQEEWMMQPGQEHQVEYPGLGLSNNFGAFNEYALPDKLGTTLTFGFAVELPYSQVPKVVSAMLNPGKDGERLLLNVVGTHVTINRQNEPTVAFDYIEDDRNDEKAKAEAAKGKVKTELPVLLSVTCQIIDFDADQVKQYE